MKTILVTGAGGFLGGYLIEQLLNMQEYKVLAFSSCKEKIQKRFANGQNIEFFDYQD